ncbi:hypothetical protein M0R45_016809 [Rubus argutus]|uniref:Uncharacterized protein n=1 Tax=Rubus argutus TaxID=59490 RepID=A0AAW1XVL5_RUBAR
MAVHLQIRNPITTTGRIEKMRRGKRKKVVHGLTMVALPSTGNKLKPLYPFTQIDAVVPVAIHREAQPSILLGCDELTWLGTVALDCEIGIAEG